MIDRSLGIVIPSASRALITPRANKSLAQKIAVAGFSSANIAFTAITP